VGSKRLFPRDMQVVLIDVRGYCLQANRQEFARRGPYDQHGAFPMNFMKLRRTHERIKSSWVHGIF
jgi:hypothetical protein